MDGIKGYSRPSPHGGVTVDVETMLVDLITVHKAGGTTKEAFMKLCEWTWGEVSVNTSLPSNKKN